jgi:hypothetical protein
MKEYDNSKIHTSSNFLLSICLLIMLDNLLVGPLLHCNTSLHFTTFHPSTLHYTSRSFGSRYYDTSSSPAPPTESCVAHYWTAVKVKIKQSPVSPGQALRVPGGWGSQISRQSAHKGGKIVSCRYRQPLPPQQTFLLFISIRGYVDPRKDYVNEKSNPRPSAL